MAENTNSETAKEPCRSVFLHGFRGDRSRAFRQEFDEKIIAEKEGSGAGPTLEECLLYAGHVGISFGDDPTIFGFSPAGDAVPAWQMLEALRRGESFPGQVSDDTSVFEAARGRGLSVYTIEYIYPESVYERIREAFAKDQQRVEANYSFPEGTGDYNCATWPQRLGLTLPELTGRMQAYIKAMSKTASPQRMGECEEQADVSE